MEMFNTGMLSWVREPKNYKIEEDKVILHTEPDTDLWQNTYYNFVHDNAPILQMSTKERYFTFTVKAEFKSKVLFDQCGIAIYLDSENWAKASIEYEDEQISKLGSVVTNNGYSDWATTDISSKLHSMYYRLSRREADFLFETSENGMNFKQMRIFHLCKGNDEVSFGVYACSPLKNSFKAVFSEMTFTECIWE
jgi:regulation of enolase protein 1 (concanavalin A-like superfamily)